MTEYYVHRGHQVFEEDNTYRCEHPVMGGKCQNIMFTEFSQALSRSTALLCAAANIQNSKGHSGPGFYLWLSKVPANERRCYMWNVFSHWLRPCSATDRKQAKVLLSTVAADAQALKSKALSHTTSSGCWVAQWYRLWWSQCVITTLKTGHFDKYMNC